MQYVNSQFRVLGNFESSRLELQLFAEEKARRSERVYTKKELGAIVKKEVDKALEAYKNNEALDISKDELTRLVDIQKKEIGELKDKLIQMELLKAASEYLKSAGVDLSDDLITFVLGKDVKETEKNVEKFLRIRESIILAADKNRSVGRTPRIIIADGGNVCTE